MVVLILILLEYGLRQDDDLVIDSFNESLNPYSTGIWSATPCKWWLASQNFLS